MGERESEKISAAKAAATAWLATVDKGDYATSWQNAAELLRNAASEAQFARSLDSALGSFGPTIRRTILNSSYRTELPGAPDGEYVVIQFSTSFENKKEAVETVTPMLEADGTWRVSGYYVK